MSEWQTIETAPKDGTRILVFAKCEPAHRYYGSARIYVSEWVAIPDPTEFSHWASDGIDFEPTHWMPLPPVPTPTAGGG